MTDSIRLYERIYQVVAQVPPGRVTTYGDVAVIVGSGCDARTVGEALGALPEQRAAAVPWQRVINSRGGISLRGLAQRALLEAEGVAFDADDRVALVRFRWPGPDAAWAAEHGFAQLPPHDDAEQLRLI
jgi:methylated-DNA-protein-cysteine methyltransferase-like protein